MKISVVIPTCDRFSLLQKCVRSVLEQSYAAYEIIIVDNGTMPVEREMLPDAETIKIVRCLPKFGVSQSRNFGAITSAGDLIAFLDDDDIWERHYLNAIVKHHQKHGSEIILGTLMSLETGKLLTGKQPHFKNKRDLIEQILIRNPGITGSNTIITRSLFFAHTGYDPYLTTGQDKAMVLDCLFLNASLSVANDAFVYFREETVGPRQTLKSKLVRGKVRFLLKYWSCMRWKHRFINLIVISQIVLFWK